MKRYLFVLLAAAAVLLVGGIAWATIPDSQGVIHGCYRPDGTLRVVDEGVACRQSETAISWNQQGQSGDRGPSDAYFTQTPTTQKLTGSDASILALNLPAGNYVINASITGYVAQSVSDARNIGCTVFAPDGNNVGITQEWVQNAGLGGSASLSITATIVSAAFNGFGEGPVALKCRTYPAPPADEWIAADATLVATQVATIHGQ